METEGRKLVINLLMNIPNQTVVVLCGIILLNESFNIHRFHIFRLQSNSQNDDDCDKAICYRNSDFSADENYWGAVELNLN